MILLLFLKSGVVGKGYLHGNGLCFPWQMIVKGAEKWAYTEVRAVIIGKHGRFERGVIPYRTLFLSVSIMNNQV